MRACFDISNDDYIYYYTWLVDHHQIPKYYGSYLKHVLNHKKLVYTAWLYIGDTLYELGFIDENDMIAINNLITRHDDSKLQRDEFCPYAKRFYGPKPKDLDVKANFKSAVRLHKGRNLHHYEALKSYKGNNWKHYAIELICDYIAMGWEFNDYICEYFETAKEGLKNELPEPYYIFIERIIRIISQRLRLAEEPLTDHNIEYIYYCYNNYNDPFERDSQQVKALKQ